MISRKTYGHMLLAATILTCPTAAALAQGSAPAPAPVDQPAAADEIIVTAQKRAQSINSVGMSVNALGSEALAARGISSPADLVKAVTGFTYTPSPTLTPVYTLRGIGFYDNTLASSPTVSVYVDEVPLPAPVMTPIATLDLERVETLKGPQGILFGQNSTGGAINYIAAKPTSSLAAGGDISFERFGRFDGSGFVSGPLSSTLRIRVAGRAVQGGDWQKSQTRPGDDLGSENKLFGRVLLDWQPSERLKLTLNLNGFRDHSDAQAAQLIAKVPVNPAASPPIFLDAPLGTHNARDADWSADFPEQFRNRFWQASGRADYELTDTVTLTSLSTYSDMKVDAFVDYDGTAAQVVDSEQIGRMRSFNQEVRIAGHMDRADWIIGGSYQHDKVFDATINNFADNTIGAPGAGIPHFQQTIATLPQKIETYAAFANIDYRLTDRLSAQAGLRYTDSKRAGTQCNADNTSENRVGNFFTILQQLFVAGGLKTTPVVPVGVRQCFFLDETLSAHVDPLPVRLHEDNVSWRLGVTYTLPSRSLLYANVSRGFKAGALAQIAGSSTLEYIPARQERVDAYEAGVKMRLLDRKLQLNAAGFYYDYRNKQVRGAFADPIFGVLEQLINVPKTRIWGIEGEINARPFSGLDLGGGITYLNSRITGSFENFNRNGTFGEFAGSVVPFTPKVSANADIQYEWTMRSLRPFVGATGVYQSRTYATFRNDADPASIFRIKGYATLDLRAGVAGGDGAWQLTVYGRNVTNSFYWTGITTASDAITRFTGRPVTYGISLSLRTR